MSVTIELSILDPPFEGSARQWRNVVKAISVHHDQGLKVDGVGAV